MRAATILILILGNLQAQINFSISTDQNMYSLSDSIYISISATNTGDYTAGLEFRNSCESAYFLDDWSSIADTSNICVQDIHMLTLEPDSMMTWSWIHDLQLNPIVEGLHAIAGIVLTEWDAKPTEPIFIQIGDATSPLPTTGFFPNTDSLYFLCGCTPPELMLMVDTLAYNGQIIQFIPFDPGQLHVPSPSGDVFPISSGYYYIFDSTAQYDFSAKLITSYGEEDFAFDSTQIIWDTEGSTMRVFIQNETIIVDSISRSFQVYISGAINESLPTALSSYSAYPNPFNPTTTIKYQLPIHAEVTLSIYDIQGRHIKTLVKKSQPTGHYETQWNGTDNDGMQVAAGMYFARLQAGSYSSVGKLVLLR